MTYATRGFTPDLLGKHPSPYPLPKRPSRRLQPIVEVGWGRGAIDFGDWLRAISAKSGNNEGLPDILPLLAEIDAASGLASCVHGHMHMRVCTCTRPNMGAVGGLPRDFQLFGYPDLDY